MKYILLVVNWRIRRWIKKKRNLAQNSTTQRKQWHQFGTLLTLSEKAWICVSSLGTCMCCPEKLPLAPGGKGPLLSFVSLEYP